MDIKFKPFIANPSFCYNYQSSSNFLRLLMDSRGRRIAVAVDEGEESIHALSWFLQNLVPDDTQTKTTIFLIYVKRPPLYPALSGTGFMFSSDLLADMEKYGTDMADYVMKRAKEVYQSFHNVQIVEKIGSGDAREVICDMVEKLSPDLLVMGSHGYGFIKRALLGSVSDHCAKEVKCPVLIVKRPNK